MNGVNDLGRPGPGTALGGLALLGVAWIAALPDSVGRLEEAVFRAVNDLPDWIEAPGWPLMQFGALLGVPLVALVLAVVTRKASLPLRFLVAGGLAWLGARLVKVLVERGRPAVYLDGVNLRPDWEGLGFPSGHAAVAFAMAAVLTPVMPRRWRIAVWVLAVIAGALRLYTGAHLPLDILGGWGLGLACAALVQIVWDRLRPSAERGS